MNWIRRYSAEITAISFIAAFLYWLFPIQNISPYIFDLFEHLSTSELPKEDSHKNATSPNELLKYLGDTTGQTRCDRVLAFFQTSHTKEPLTIDDLLKVITGIPRNLYCRQKTVLITLRNSNTVLTASEAARILETLDNAARTSFLSDMLCYIERPIKETEKKSLLSMVDPLSLSPIKSNLDLPEKPSCEM